MAPFFKKKKHSKSGSQDSNQANHTNDSNQRTPPLVHYNSSSTHSAQSAHSNPVNAVARLRSNSEQKTPPPAGSRNSSYNGHPIIPGQQQTPVRNFSNSFNPGSRSGTPVQQQQQQQQQQANVGFATPNQSSNDTQAYHPPLNGSNTRQYANTTSPLPAPTYRDGSGNMYSPVSNVVDDVYSPSSIVSHQPQSQLNNNANNINNINLSSSPFEANGTSTNGISQAQSQQQKLPTKVQQDQRSPQNLDQEPQSHSIPQSLDTPWKKKRLYNSPFPRFSHAASSTTSDNGAIYLMGGLCGQNVFGDMWVIEPVKNEQNAPGYEYPYIASPIENFERVPAPRIGHSAVLIGNAFIVFAGDTVTSSTQVLDNRLYFFNITSLKWTVTAPEGPRPDGRYGHQIAVLNFETEEEPVRWLSYLYVFGGQLEDKYFSDIWRFDLSNFRDPNTHWVKLETPENAEFVPPALANHSMSAYGSALYIYGGTDGKTVYSDLLCFEAESESWKKCNLNGEFKPPPLEDHATGLYQNLLFIYGGKIPNGETNHDLYLIDLNNYNCFKIISDLPFSPGPRSGHSLTVDLLNEKLIIMGGDQDDNDFTNVYETENEIIDENQFRYPSSVVYEFDMDLLPKYMEKSLRNVVNRSVNNRFEVPPVHQNHSENRLSYRKSQHGIYEDISDEEPLEDAMEEPYDHDRLEKSLMSTSTEIQANNKDGFSSSTPIFKDAGEEYGQIPSVHLDSPMINRKSDQSSGEHQDHQEQREQQEQQEQHHSQLSRNVSGASSKSSTGFASVALGGTASAMAEAYKQPPTSTDSSPQKSTHPLRAISGEIKTQKLKQQSPEKPKLGSPLVSQSPQQQVTTDFNGSPNRSAAHSRNVSNSSTNSNSNLNSNGSLNPTKLQAMIQNLKLEFSQKVSEANDRIVELEKEKNDANIKINGLEAQLSDQKQLSSSPSATGISSTRSLDPTREIKDGNSDKELSPRSRIAYENKLLHLNNENTNLKEKVLSFEPFMNSKIESLQGLNSIIKSQQLKIKELESKIIDQVELQKSLNQSEKKLNDLSLEFDKFKLLNGSLDLPDEDASVVDKDKHADISNLNSKLDSLLGLWTKTSISDSIDKSVDKGINEKSSTNNNNNDLVEKLQSQIDELLKVKNSEDEETTNLKNNFENNKKKFTDLEENYKQSISSLNNTHRALSILQEQLEKQKDTNKKLHSELEELKLKKRVASPRNFSGISLPDHNRSASGSAGFPIGNGGLIEEENEQEEEASENTRFDFKIKDLQADLYIVTQERDQLRDELTALKKRMLFDSRESSTA